MSSPRVWNNILFSPQKGFKGNHSGSLFLYQIVIALQFFLLFLGCLLQKKFQTVRNNISDGA